MDFWVVIFDSVSIRFPNGWEISVPAWVIAISGIVFIAALAALSIWGIVRLVNRPGNVSHAKRPIDRP